MRARNLGLSCLLGVAVACAGTHPAPSPAPVPNTASADHKDRIPVQIDNQNYSDMEIYVVRSGQRWLIGQAGGLTKTTLTIRNAIRGNGQVRLLADPVGGARPITTPTLVVPPGQSIFWTIGSDPATSTASTG